LAKLGKYGVHKAHVAGDASLSKFDSQQHTAGMDAAANAIGAKYFVFAQSYNGRAVAPRLAVRQKATLFSGVHELPKIEGGVAHTTRVVYSNKGLQNLKAGFDKVVFTVKPNSFQAAEHEVSFSSAAFSFDIPATKLSILAVDRRSGDIALTEAETVVSAGRGLKGPENWGMVEELAALLGAATACSKPVSDVHWRPHHEHVGQTGIQVSPNVYIAIGISGAIQHLAGVSASKTIIVINKDADAPFFKAADFGVVGDAFEVVPKLVEAVKAYKAKA
jgi:electron transfer flavoprotein alpha subunit